MTLRVTWLFSALFLVGFWAPLACSSGEDGDDQPSTNTGGTAASGAASGSGGLSGGPGGAGGADWLGPGEPYDNTRAPFKFGLNLGHPNSAWGDDLLARLGARAGATSLRPKLSEYHLERWGYEIEVGDMRSYAADGLGEHTAFVIGATREHSTMPASAADWERDYYVPKNLHEPIWLENGEVNPDNYFAASLFRTMSVYGPWVSTWEIWNEPDWVPDWQTTERWWDEPPTKEQLVRFGGSIFDYVRMLRIATEVRDKAAPNTRVGLGGIGYPSFLDAILRYTDEPSAGSVDAAHPRTGANYFDVVVFHYYPHFSPGNSDVAARGLLSAKKNLEDVLAARGVSPASRSFIVTESGASHVAIENTPSGAEYARNYLTKVMPLAHRAGIEALHWFILSDGSELEPPSPFDAMGLYADLSGLTSIEEARLTTNGVALRTLSTRLAEAYISEAARARAVHGAEADVVGYRLPDGRAAWVAWAVASDGEAETANVGLETEALVSVFDWDASETGETSTLSPEDGRVTLSVTSSPVIVIESPN